MEPADRHRSRKRPPHTGTRGFTLQPRTWVVEQTGTRRALRLCGSRHRADRRWRPPRTGPARPGGGAQGASAGSGCRSGARERPTPPCRPSCPTLVSLACPYTALQGAPASAGHERAAIYRRARAEKPTRPRPYAGPQGIPGGRAKALRRAGWRGSPASGSAGHLCREHGGELSGEGPGSNETHPGEDRPGAAGRLRTPSGLPQPDQSRTP